MIKRLAFLLTGTALGTLVVTTVATTVVTTVVTQTKGLAQTMLSEAAVQKILRQRIDQEKRGVAIVVGLLDPQGSKIISYGRLSQSNSRPPDGDTVFEIGSITKVFTALLLADMVQRGELRLDDAIAQFLPKTVKLPSRNGQAITLRHLATHTSGLPRLPSNFAPKDPENPYADYTIAQLYAFLASYTLPRDIGAEYEYSNLGAGLLGHLLSLKAGMDYETLVLSRICQPLQMASTRITLPPDLKARLAPGHNLQGKVVPNWDLPTLAGAGALRSSTNDLLKFLAANLGLKRASLSAAMRQTHLTQHKTETPDLAMGLGWHQFNQYGTILFHDGGTGGYRSFIGFRPKQQLGVVVLSNSETDVADIGLHLLDRRYPLLQYEPPRQRQAITLNPKLYDLYVGRYELAPGFILSITKAEERLYLQATGQPRVELFPETETEFFLTEVDAQIVFIREADGRINSLMLHQNGQKLRAKRLE